MKVIFLKDVPETADAGEVKEVKNGFARNYLLPNGLAAPATPDQLQRVRAIEKAAHETRRVVVGPCLERVFAEQFEQQGDLFEDLGDRLAIHQRSTE